MVEMVGEDDEGSVMVTYWGLEFCLCLVTEEGSIVAPVFDVLRGWSLHGYGRGRCGWGYRQRWRTILEEGI